ncbi:hypothetical protein ACHAPT_003817 [Fusarium lateritium]
MRVEARQSFVAMTGEVGRLDNTLGRHLEFHDKPKVKNRPASSDQRLREPSRVIKWMDKDPVHDAKAKAYSRLGKPVPSDMEVRRILLYSPILTGLYLFRLRTEMYDASLAVANAWGSITYTAHLYNALLEEGFLESQWHDMDIVLVLFGDSSIWLGGERPKTLEDCFQMLCLQMGVSAAAFTTNRRRKAPIASRTNPRGMKEGAPVSSVFKAQICTGAETNWTPELIDGVVALSAHDYDELVDEGVGIMPEELRDRHRLQQQRAKARAAGKDIAVDDLAPEELAMRLALTLDSESFEISFPYLLVHRWCWTGAGQEAIEVARRIGKDIQFGDDYEEDTEELEETGV